MSLLHVPGRIGFTPLVSFDTLHWEWHCTQCEKMLGVSRRGTDLDPSVLAEVCPANWWDR